VLIHGAYADKKEHMINRFASRLNRAGVACIAYDLPGHGERMGQDKARFRQSLGLLLLQSAIARGQNVPPEFKAMAALVANGSLAKFDTLAPIVSNGIGHAVVDARRVIDYLATRPEVDTARISVCGMSLGGTVSILLASVDERVQAACLYVTGAWEEFATASNDERTKQAWTLVDPAAHAARLTRPTLMLNGQRDPVVPTSDAKALFNHLAGPKDQKWYNAGHQPAPDALDDGALWLAAQAGVALPAVIEPKRK
jgi:dienelactone hydrolase